MSKQRISALFLCVALAGCATGDWHLPAMDDLIPSFNTNEQPMNDVLDTQTSNAQTSRGKVLLNSGKNAEARDAYADAVQLDKKNARAWNGLGVANDMLGNRDEAKDAYQHALELEPNNLLALNNLAHLYLETGDAEAAVQLLQPHAKEAGASTVLRENLASATKAARLQKDAKTETYADLGAYPTDGRAQAFIEEARNALGDKAKELTFSVVPEVKISGGTPVFTVRAGGRAPQAICEELMAKALPCVPHGK